MLELLEPSASRRRSVRRAVAIETEITCGIWDGAVSLLATDLSPHGMWLETALPLDPGDEVSVRVSAPGFAAEAPLCVTARVARVGLYRRRAERTKSGMGLAFAPLSPPDMARLVGHLRGLPPPMPRLAEGAPPRPVADGGRAAHGVEDGRPGLGAPVTPEDALCLPLPDGNSASWTALGPLLTAGRRRAQGASPDQLADVIPLPLLRTGA